MSCGLTRALLVCVSVFAPSFAERVCHAQVPMTELGVPYTEDFDSLANTGTSPSVPLHWAFFESGTNANTTYAAGTGSSSTGNTYAFGADGSSERAFGGVQSSALVPTIGLSYTNDTGATIGVVVVSYHGEQWRLGNTGRVDRLDFQVSYGATGVGDPAALWLDVDPLDFVAPVTSGTVGALDGNANQVAVSYVLDLRVIAGLLGVPAELVLIPDGFTMWIRWKDFNASGSDDGLAVDDFELTVYCGADPDCDDGIPCTADRCVSGICQHAPDDVACDDDDACTTDLCEVGIGCLNEPLTCADGATCTADHCNPAVGCERVPDDARCDDGFTCTVDVCAPGAAGADVATGCVSTPSDGACDDGDACTVGDACDAGTCQPGTRPRRCADGNVCTDDACDPLIGCVFTFNTDACDDGLLGTSGDRCHQGTCVGTSILCPLPNQCQVARANGETCSLTPLPTGTMCDDGSWLTADDACDGAGTCRGTTIVCPTPGPCQAPGTPNGINCIPGAAPKGTTCDDGLATTANDRCDGRGACTGTAIVCPTPAPCERPGAPNGVECVVSFAPSGEACDDGDRRTRDDLCDGQGRCLGTPIVCPTPGPCQSAGTPDGVTCQLRDAPTNTRCDDGDDATFADRCDGHGGCVGTPIACPADTACATHAPDGVGCTMTPRAGPCDDGRADTRDDACRDGACAGIPYACAPAACEASSVPDGVGCAVTFVAAGTPCDDGALDTRADRCDAAGGCRGTSFVCTPGPCEASSVPDGEACVAAPAAAGTACDDLDPCTLDDACDGASACLGKPIECGDGEICDRPGACQPTHCAPCETDADCDIGSACLDVDGVSRCLLACADDLGCAVSQSCVAHGVGGPRCFDREGACAAPATEPEAGPEVVEAEPERTEVVEVELAELAPEDVAPEPEDAAPPPETIAVEADVADAAPDTGGARSDDSGEGCTHGATPTFLALLALAFIGRRRARVRETALNRVRRSRP